MLYIAHCCSTYDISTVFQLSSDNFLYTDRFVTVVLILVRADFFHTHTEDKTRLWNDSQTCLKVNLNWMAFNFCFRNITWLLYIFYRARSVHDWWWIFARLWQLAAIYLEIWCNQRDVEFWNKVLYTYLENISTLTCLCDPY